jgi:hypothetical protein
VIFCAKDTEKAILGGFVYPTGICGSRRFKKTLISAGTCVASDVTRCLRDKAGSKITMNTYFIFILKMA